MTLTPPPPTQNILDPPLCYMYLDIYILLHHKMFFPPHLSTQDCGFDVAFEIVEGNLVCYFCIDRISTFLKLLHSQHNCHHIYLRHVSPLSITPYLFSIHSLSPRREGMYFFFLLCHGIEIRFVFP